jgi:hypothetical protein
MERDQVIKLLYPLCILNDMKIAWYLTMDLQKETPGVRGKIRAYVKGNHGHDTPMMVRVTAPSEMARPVDVVLVLHINMSCIIPSNWHLLLKEATKLVTEKLGDHDRLALVPALSKETVTVSERSIFSKAMFSTDEHQTAKESEILTSKSTFDVPANPKLLLMTTENRTSVSNLVESSESMRSYTPLETLLETAESVSRQSK